MAVEQIQFNDPWDVETMEALFNDTAAAKGDFETLTACIEALALKDMSNAAAATTSSPGVVMLSSAFNDASQAKAATPYTIKTISETIQNMIDAGAKNFLPYDLAAMKAGNASAGYTWSGNVCTISDGSTLNIVITVGDDGVITATGSKPATSSGLNFRIVPAANAFDLPLGDYVLSGCPSGGSSSTYQLRALINSSSVFAQDTGNAGEFTTTSKTIERVEIAFGTSSISTINLTFRPMICPKAYWAISHEYRQFMPSNYQLYDMIKALS